MKVQSNQNLIYRYNFKRGCDGENPEQMEPSLYLHFLLQRVIFPLQKWL